jgi:hypothetical protein
MFTTLLLIQVLAQNQTESESESSCDFTAAVQELPLFNGSTFFVGGATASVLLLSDMSADPVCLLLTGGGGL